MARYAAKLLFQFRVVVEGHSNKRRLCEDRIVILQADSARQALRMAKKRGKAGEHRYRKSDNNPVLFEFIGVMELLSLDPVAQPDEVWYDIVTRVLPMERRQALIPPESSLEAIRNEWMP